jgi:dTDP-4-amino-4,6-dideoxygalactose transaminase
MAKKMKRIPFVDLGREKSLHRHLLSAAKNVLRKGVFIQGAEVTRFEKNFAGSVGVRYAIGVASGTEALRLALLACGIKPGDEVITVANSFFATAAAISLVGAKPVFADVEESTLNLNPKLLSRLITRHTKAIIPVHLFGHPADMDPIMQIANRHKLRVIEDAAQGHGAKYKGKYVGAIGDVGIFSFYPTKNLGAYGDAGAIVTNNPKIAKTMRLLREYGRDRLEHHVMVGGNSRLDELQAAFLNEKLPLLHRFNRQRKKIATVYQRLITAKEIRYPVELRGYRHVYHHYVIRAKKRDALMNFLARSRIETRIHYPTPIHRQPAYRKQYHRQHLPITEQSCREILSLPMHHTLTLTEARQISHAINSFYGK